MYGKVVYRERWGKVETSLQNPAPVKVLEAFRYQKNSLRTAAHDTYLQFCLFFKIVPLFWNHPSSSNILNLHLTLLRFSVCTVWPSLLIFFFHFYSLPADHSAKSPSDC